jgi:aspartate/methionine/tyrosine aminotransferase
MTVYAFFHGHSLAAAGPSPVMAAKLRQPSRALSAAAGGGGGRPFSSPSEASGPRTSSARGRRVPDLLPIYLTDARAIERYCPETCPDGALQLSVAENQMLEDRLVPALAEFSAGVDTAEKLFASDMIYYQPTHGRPGLRGAMARYLERVLGLPEGIGTLDEEGLVVGAGCNAVLENLCLCLAGPGDGVLIPTPYYAAFEFDLVARAGLKIVPVRTMGYHPEVGGGGAAGDDDDGPIPVEAYYPNRSSLDAAAEAARAEGTEPRILLLSHPNNPLGLCYPPSVVRDCIDWGRENQIHIVSDEIYAGSVYRNSGEASEGDTTFLSSLQIAAGHEAQKEEVDGGSGLGLGPYVHFVYALSKDFCLSGMRVGASYSENPEIRLPMQKLNDLCQISSQTQLVVERMLTTPSSDGDGQWTTDDFLPEARNRLRARAERLEQCLDGVGVPHLISEAGMFTWIDLREFLPPRESSEVEGEQSFDRRERALYLELLKEHGLLFTPGRSMKNELPGFFRLVFTAASEEEFDLGLERLKSFVRAKRDGAS